MSRQKRKLDHIKLALESDKGPGGGFADIRLVHQSLPDLNLMEVDTSFVFQGKKLDAPVIINAMTGGHPATIEINRGFAAAARLAGVAMAVGSQKAALDDPSVADTYSVAREENPDGVIIANLSAACTVDEAVQAVAMLDADALQVHLNAPQELVMGEGEPDFSDAAGSLDRLTENLTVPVIAKEVGFGMSGETVQKLYRLGIGYMDISGYGGTNFASIEYARRGLDAGEMAGWGIPTAVSLFESLELGLPVKVIASGGLYSAQDWVKALAAGAKMVAAARPFLKLLVEGSVEALVDHLERMKREMKMYMLLAGASDLAGLGSVPLVITGDTAEWLVRRGVDINSYSRR